MWLIVVAYVAIGLCCFFGALTSPRPQDARGVFLGFLSVGCLALLRDLFVYLGGLASADPTWVAAWLQALVGFAIVIGLSIVALIIACFSEDCDLQS